MKRILLATVVVFCAAVCVLHLTERYSAYACPAENSFDASDSGAVTIQGGQFSYTMWIEWALTFDPFYVLLDYYPNGQGSTNIASATPVPSAYLTDDDCISDEPAEVYVAGWLIYEDQAGNVDNRIKFTAGYPYEYIVPHATYIPPEP